MVNLKNLKAKEVYFVEAEWLSLCSVNWVYYDSSNLCAQYQTYNSNYRKKGFLLNFHLKGHSSYQGTMAKAVKMSPKNKRFCSGDYFAMITFCAHSILLTNCAENGPVEVQ